MTKNKASTRYHSSIQEAAVCKATNASRQPNSGAGHFAKGDCINKEASMLIECKTSVTEKSSISIKKEWLEKLAEEAFAVRCQHTALAFNFGPLQKNYYIISEQLMKLLIETLSDS